MHRLFRLWLLPALAIDSTSRAALVNVTIDDTGLQYSPPELWNIGNCALCQAHPDPGLAFHGTWHDSTYPLVGPPAVASVSFNGTAVYVMCILAQSAPFLDGTSDMTFFIDGVVAGSFQQSAPTTAQYIYSVPVFTKTALSPGTHSISIHNGQAGTVSLTLLDSIIYTMDTPDPVSQSPPDSAEPTSGPPSTNSPSSAHPSSESSAVINTQSSISPTSSLSLAVTKPVTSDSTNEVSSTSTQDTTVAPLSSNTSISTGRPSVPPQQASQSHSHINVGAIVGGVIAAVFVLILLVIVMLCLRKRFRRKEDTNPYVDAFTSLSPETPYDRIASKAAFSSPIDLDSPSPSANNLPLDLSLITREKKGKDDEETETQQFISPVDECTTHLVSSEDMLETGQTLMIQLPKGHFLTTLSQPNGQRVLSISPLSNQPPPVYSG